MEEAGVWQQEWRELWATGLTMAANSKESVQVLCGPRLALGGQILSKYVWPTTLCSAWAAEAQTQGIGNMT